MTSDERLRDAYERGLARGVDREPLDDLASERLRRVVDREGPVEERLHTIDALLSSAEGRQDLDIALAAARAARVPAWHGNVWRVAAAVLIAAGGTGIWLVTREAPNVLRSEESPIALVSPIGATAAASTQRFTWRAAADVDHYTLVLVDSLGNEVFAGETRDTTLALPDSVALQPGGSYLWWVQARTRLGASITAVTQRLVVTP